MRETQKNIPQSLAFTHPPSPALCHATGRENLPSSPPSPGGAWAQGGVVGLEVLPRRRLRAAREEQRPLRRGDVPRPALALLRHVGRAGPRAATGREAGLGRPTTRGLGGWILFEPLSNGGTFMFEKSFIFIFIFIFF